MIATKERFDLLRKTTLHQVIQRTRRLRELQYLNHVFKTSGMGPCRTADFRNLQCARIVHERRGNGSKVAFLVYQTLLDSTTSSNLLRRSLRFCCRQPGEGIHDLEDFKEGTLESFLA